MYLSQHTIIVCPEKFTGCSQLKSLPDLVYGRVKASRRCNIKQDMQNSNYRRTVLKGFEKRQPSGCLIKLIILCVFPYSIQVGSLMLGPIAGIAESLLTARMLAKVRLLSCVTS